LAANRQAAAPPRKKAAIPPVAYIIGIVVVLGAAGFWYLDSASKRPAPPPAPLTGDAKAYVRNLKLSNVDMNAHESYMKQQVVEITGSIQNNGDRALDVVEINCVFHDAYGQLVLRERVPIVTKKMGGLAPGEIKSFRLPFDSIPESWNQAMPDMVIARIEFT
jgi:hypothetical protein